MGPTSEEPGPAPAELDEPGLDWYGLPSPELLRAALGLIVAAAASALGGLILGEYQFTGTLPLFGGPLFGLVVGELVVGVGRRRTWPVAVAAAAFVAGGILWAGWISSGASEELPSGAVLAAGLGAVVTLVRVGRRRRRPSRAR